MNFNKNQIIIKDETNQFKLGIIENTLFMINSINNTLSKIDLLDNKLVLGDSFDNSSIYSKHYNKHFLLKNCNVTVFSNDQDKEIYINKEFDNIILTLGYCKYLD